MHAAGITGGFVGLYLTGWILNTTGSYPIEFRIIARLVLLSGFVAVTIVPSREKRAATGLNVDLPDVAGAK